LNVFITSFACVSGGFLGLVASWHFYKVIKKLCCLCGKKFEEKRHKDQLDGKREKARLLLESDEEVREVVSELIKHPKNRRGVGHVREKLQRRLDTLVDDKDIREIFYSQS